MTCVYFEFFPNGIYDEFIDYCLMNSDTFMLSYVKYPLIQYAHIMDEIEEGLAPLQIKKRTNASWPGTPETYCHDAEYKIIFYSCAPKAKTELSKVNNLFEWTRPNMPQDLAFFRQKKCWLFTVGHEKYAGIIDPTDKDITFLTKHGLYDTSKIGHISPQSEWQFFEDI